NAESPGMSVTIDRGDQRLAQTRHRLVHADQGLRIRCALLGSRPGAPIIAAKTEDVTVACHDTTADLRIATRCIEPRRDFDRHPGGDAVAAGGALERQDHDASVAGYFELRAGCVHRDWKTLQDAK